MVNHETQRTRRKIRPLAIIDRCDVERELLN